MTNTDACVNCSAPGTMLCDRCHALRCDRLGALVRVAWVRDAVGVAILTELISTGRSK